MKSKRIEELVKMLWDEINSSEDIKKFMEAYGDELDEDFLMAVATIVDNAKEKGDENVSRFFHTIGYAVTKYKFNKISREHTEITKERARPQHYVFAHRLLPKMLFDDPDLMITQMTNEKEYLEFLKFVWNKAGKISLKDESIYNQEINCSVFMVIYGNSLINQKSRKYFLILLPGS